MIRSVVWLDVLPDDDPNEPGDLVRLSRFCIEGTESRESNKWLTTKLLKLCFATSPVRNRHPLLYPRKMICKRIENITRTNHDTYLVYIRRDADDVILVTIDCKTIINIETNPNDNSTIVFTFEEYFSKEEQTELREMFLNGKYDELGDTPEY
jgi:hypothetical protein